MMCDLMFNASIFSWMIAHLWSFWQWIYDKFIDLLCLLMDKFVIHLIKESVNNGGKNEVHIESISTFETVFFPSSILFINKYLNWAFLLLLFFSFPTSHHNRLFIFFSYSWKFKGKFVAVIKYYEHINNSSHNMCMYKSFLCERHANFPSMLPRITFHTMSCSYCASGQYLS